MRAGRYPEDHRLEILARRAQYERAIANLKQKPEQEPKAKLEQSKPKRSRW